MSGGGRVPTELTFALHHTPKLVKLVNEAEEHIVGAWKVKWRWCCSTHAGSVIVVGVWWNDIDVMQGGFDVGGAIHVARAKNFSDHAHFN